MSSPPPSHWCRDQDPVPATHCMVVEPAPCTYHLSILHVRVVIESIRSKRLISKSHLKDFQFDISVTVCTDFSGKELQRQSQVGVDGLMISGSLDGVMVITQTQSKRDVGSIPLSHFHHSHVSFCLYMFYICVLPKKRHK